MNNPAKIKIFLVDDDMMFVESLKHLLSEERADIRSFDNGEDCIKYLDELPEIIILDYSLNNTLNGIQVLNKIKHVSPETEVIMLSGVDNHAIMKDTLKYGAYDFIEKGESATFKLRKEVKQICDEIEAAQKSEKDNNRMLMVNVTIIILFIIIFILTRIK
jgi:DNA-binding NtrC family response regulator